MEDFKNRNRKGGPGNHDRHGPRCLSEQGGAREAATSSTSVQPRQWIRVVETDSGRRPMSPRPTSALIHPEGVSEPIGMRIKRFTRQEEVSSTATAQGLRRLGPGQLAKGEAMDHAGWRGKIHPLQI